MTERRKAKVGDTIRLNGKNPARQSGEHVVNRVADARHTHPDEGVSTYWVEWNDDSDDPDGSAWEQQFDIVEPEPQFNKGDKVKLTPKDGGETVVYGEYQDEKWGLHRVMISHPMTNSFSTNMWNIEVVKPTTEEILNALGENAYVAHRTDPDWRAYAKVNGEWHEVGRQFEYEISAADVGGFIELNDFEIIFEGVKDE